MALGRNATDTILSMATSIEFIAGLSLGLVGAAAARPWLRRGESRRVESVGVGWVASLATLLGLGLVRWLPALLVFGLGALAWHGWAVAGKRKLWVRLVSLGAGSFLVGLAIDVDAGLVRWAAVPVVALSVSALMDADRRVGGLGAVLLVLTVAGVLATVPGTEQALVLSGATLPLLLLPGAGDGRHPLGTVGVATIGGLLIWAIAMGGYPRPTAIVGGLGSLGLFILIPVSGTRPGRRWGLAEAVLHAGLVVVSARVAGLRESMLPAILISVAAYVVAFAALRLGDPLARSVPAGEP